MDGKPLRQDLSKFRVRTNIFHMRIPDNNVLEIPPAEYRLVSDGYWLFFRPLSRSMEITSFGACSSGLTEIGVHYSLSQS